MMNAMDDLALPQGYEPLLESVVDVLAADERVLAAWVHGSVARGDADDASDLDVIMAVDDAKLLEFGADWRARVDAITPTVMARRFPGPGGSVLTITPMCQRLDQWVEAASEVRTSVVRRRRVLFDRAGLDAQVPKPDPPAVRSEAKLSSLRDRCARVLAVAMVAEDDPLLVIEVIHALRLILYDVYVETNRPLPETGLKQWSAKLTPEQRTRFESLPTAGRAAPVIAAIDDVLGRPSSDAAAAPELASVTVPPEGAIRALMLGPLPPDERMRHIAEEFFAIHLYLGLVVHRSDWLLGIDGVQFARKLLYELFLEELGRPTASSSGDWSGRLTDEQRSILLSLPTGEATAAAVVGGHLAVRDAFVRRGRPLLGDLWPFAMEEAVGGHVDGQLAAAGLGPG